MPIAINPNRPPSVPPNGGGNGPPRTTTSRRGGRTRSRSPPVVGGRGDVLPGASGAGGNTGTENPSSAAAAAAAAAKNFSTSGGGAAGVGGVRSTWPGEGGEDSPFVEKQYTGSRQPQQQQWSGEQDYGMRRYPAGSYGAGGPPFRQHPGESMDYGDRRGGGGHRSSYQPQRFDTDRSGGGSARYSSPPSSRYPPQEAYRYDQRSRPASSSSHHNHHHHHPPQRSGSGGTTLVLGGATPIHVPKKPGGSYDRGGSAASVFRGRPDTDPRSTSAADDDDDSPQKILLSLRTPTTSFEDKGVDKTKKGGLSLSPTDPPQIQNSHQSRQSSDALFEVSQFFVFATLLMPFADMFSFLTICVCAF